MKELRDISGLEPITWYQIAPGWLLLFAAALLVILLMLRWRRIQAQKKVTTVSWQHNAAVEWQRVSQIVSPRDRLEAIATLLRRVAMQRYGRESCAGLTGYEWLRWLTEHDPQQFAWTTEAEILIKLPYMPPNAEIEPEQVDKLLAALQTWLH